MYIYICYIYIYILYIYIYKNIFKKVICGLYSPLPNWSRELNSYWVTISKWKSPLYRYIIYICILGPKWGYP